MMRDIEALSRDIATEVRLTAGWTGKDHLDPRVSRAIRAVPRDRFVPEELQPFAFENAPLQIGCGQTISQPYIVALMSDLLGPLPTDRMLEIGAGSGYQAAVLACIVKAVYSVEIIPELAEAAAQRLKTLGFGNVSIRRADGCEGWPEQAPFDGIIVTAAAPQIPPALIAQLKTGRRLVIPIGAPHGHQQLVVGTKQVDGTLTTRVVLDVAFVPLTGAMGMERPDRSPAP